MYTIPFRGCFVAKITEKDILEVFQLHEASETFCVKYACKILSDEEIQRVKEIISEAEGALRQDDIKSCFVSNLRFHDFLISKSKNEKIIKTYSNVINHLNRLPNIGILILGKVAKSHKAYVSH